jgi:hypothetical protein
MSLGTLTAQRDTAQKTPPGLAAMRHAFTTRLDALGMPADFVAPDAQAAILEQCGSSKRRLHMLLATAVFLAETEHASHIDLALAQRAASLQPPEQPPTPDFWPVIRRKDYSSLRIIAVPIAAMALAGAFFTMWPRSMPASAPVATAAASSASTTKVASVSTPPPAAISASAEPAQHLTLSPPPQFLDSEAPSPAAYAPIGHLVPHPTCVLLHFFVFSPGSAPRARFLEQHLRAAGYEVRMLPELTRPPRRGAMVRFFHAPDRPIACLVENATVLLATEPTLLPATHHRHVPPAGTIELFIP